MPEKSKISILYTIPNFITAGSGRVMVNILERLDTEKFMPTVCVLKRGGALEQELENKGIRVLQAPFTLNPKPYATLAFRAKKLSQFYRPFKFNLWHSFHYADDYTEPLIARFSGAGGWVYTKKAMSWGSRAWVLRSLLASRIVADNSEIPGLFFNRWGLAKKTRVIHHGIPLDQFYPREVDRASYRIRMGLQEDAILIGCVAHLLPVKGQSTLIEAAKLMPEVHLMFAGRMDDAAYFAHLKELTASLNLQDRVHFLGNVAGVPDFLAQMDIVTLPTWDKWRREGCPVSLIEAMACGRACVATSVPGSRDIIENGVSGLLVPPEDPQALAAALHGLITNPEKRTNLEKQARLRIREHFSIEKEVAAHQVLYADILKK